MGGKINLLGMPRRQLMEFFAELGEKPYRSQQVMNWVYRAGVDDFMAMTDIGKPLRARLADTAEIRPPVFAREQRAGDGVVKWLVRVSDDQAVETVLIPDTAPRQGSSDQGPDERQPLPAKRHTLCISTQVGCALDCGFCATGKQGFNRNLTAAEIVGQALLAQRFATQRGASLTNIVFMGMGEPLLNYDAVMMAVRVFADDMAFGVANRRVTVSTVGVVPRIYDLATHSNASLAVSLHAPRDALRDQLVPVNRKYPLADLLAACRHYLRARGPRHSITFVYTLIAGVNDSLAEAWNLARLLRDLRCKVNLIPFNPFPGDPAGYRRPDPTAVSAFRNVLVRAGLTTTRRTTRGDAINAACGQLTGKFVERSRRRAQYQTPLQLIAQETAA